MKTKIYVLAIIIIVGGGVSKAFSQDTIKSQENVNLTGKGPIVYGKPPANATTEYKLFWEKGVERLKDNDNSLYLLRSFKRIKNIQAIVDYNYDVDAFEKRNNEMKKRMLEIDGSGPQFKDLARHWNWDMDELTIYEKNVMTENYLNR